LAPRTRAGCGTRVSIAQRGGGADGSCVHWERFCGVTSLGRCSSDARLVYPGVCAVPTRVWSTLVCVSFATGVLASSSRCRSIIYRKLGHGGGEGARKEEPIRGSLNEFVNQTRTRSLNGPLKPRLTVD
jgi:hypothetical protein